MAVTKEKIIETIGNMSSLEILAMVKDMEEQFGVAAAMPMGNFAPAQTEASQETAREATEFNVVLMASGMKKIRIIKEVRAITNLSLRDAKSLVDYCPSAIQERVNKETAGATKRTLEEAGATVQVTDSQTDQVVVL